MSRVALVTGAAGFIGSQLVTRLVASGQPVLGLDNFDDFYSPAIKRDNIRTLAGEKGFSLIEGDIRDERLLEQVFSNNEIGAVLHLAGRAGVRPSLEQASFYEDVNVKGTLALLDCSRRHKIEKFVFASSSSVYGLNAKAPFSEIDKVDYPISPYAASKASAELFCRTYSHLYGLPVIALRLFTVYGPRQRPEMAIHRFVSMIDHGDEVPVYGDGSAKRDFTYVDDIVSGFQNALDYNKEGFEIFNLGGGRTVDLMYLLRVIEDAVGKKARIKHLPVQPGDVPLTFADVSKARALLHYDPKVTIEHGIDLFVRWYRESKS